eukprot:scaffold129750_cov51-Attheya_sp.AAC.1
MDDAGDSNKANVDCHLILDCGKVTQYMSKYVTKTEACCSKSMAAMIKKIMERAVRDGRNMKHVLQKVMARLIGERMMSEQE